MSAQKLDSGNNKLLPKKPRSGLKGLSSALNILGVLLLAAAVFLAWMRFTSKQQSAASSQPQAVKNLQSAISNQQSAIALPEFAAVVLVDEGIGRRPEFKTIIPSRPRVDVITYTVQRGDNLFNIADVYGLKAETILWGNYDTLKDNPHMIQPGQVLNILPVNGVYYQWQAGDSLNGVASNFKTDAKEILDFPGNHLDLTIGITKTVGIQPGAWLIVPDGKRPIKDWGPPAITRQNPAVARYYGSGACGSIYTGAIGTGSFIWPTVSHVISGYTFSALHPAIDIAGGIGAPVVASDSGVIVYAGWSTYGYGNLLVIDHGNGFQTAYAHLSAFNVGCGQSVFQGSLIGAVGDTGNAFGSHLHFELSYNGAKLNPLDYLP